MVVGWEVVGDLYDKTLQIFKFVFLQTKYRTFGDYMSI